MKVSPIILPEEFDFLVDRNMTLNQMIVAGRYDMSNRAITSQSFSVKGRGRTELKGRLVHFSSKLSSSNVVKKLDKMNKRLATIEELLAFGAKYPEIQRNFPVVALGSSCNVGGYRSVPYLFKFDSRRALHLHSWVGGWTPSHRFLVFDK